MSWFNYYGTAIMAIIMLPNIIYVAKHKATDGNAYTNKALTVMEQIGRYGCFFLMIFNIPYLYFDFWFNHALTVYLTVNGGLCLAYLMFWVTCGSKNGLLKALSLSILPSCIFMFSGVVLAYVPLLVFSVVFAACHITISVKTIAKPSRKKLSEMTLGELWRLFPIFLVEHDVRWAEWYSDELTALKGLLPFPAEYYHIGSTAVKGIYAKPIIDIIIALQTPEQLGLTSKILQNNGYLAMSGPKIGSRSTKATPKTDSRKRFSIFISDCKTILTKYIFGII